jgi:NADH dehydrogenase
MMEELRYIPNISDTDKKRIVVVGSGFAGLKFVRSILRKNFQIVLLDKNNFHQFQPLLYQVAIQQAKTLAGNLIRIKRNASLKSKDFEYRDKGALATIGRNLAVAHQA